MSSSSSEEELKSKKSKKKSKKEHKHKKHKEKEKKHKKKKHRRHSSSEYSSSENEEWIEKKPPPPKDFKLDFEDRLASLFQKPSMDSDEDDSPKYKIPSKTNTAKKAIIPRREISPQSFPEIKYLPSSSSTSTTQNEEPQSAQSTTTKPSVLTDKEMNELGAKIIKAELMGNTDLLTELKRKQEIAIQNREEWIKNGGNENFGNRETKVVTKIIMGGGGENPRKRGRDKPGVTHKDGERIRYFPDDDKKSLSNMFVSERMNTTADENALFSRIAGKLIKPNEDYDVDDVFVDKASSSKKAAKEKEREVRKIVEEEKQYNKTIEDCQWCFDSNKLQKNLIIAVGEKSYLSVPPFQSLTDGHCLIVPMHHISSTTHLDEDIWEEMMKFRSAVVNMCLSMDQDVIVFESAVFLQRHPHMYIECVPLPKEVGDLAPIYFKKAIQECETEWSSNKKVVELKGRNVRSAVPKGLPYFFVDFGMDSGFAHVIEEERYFPQNFAQEIIGGMMELDHSIWRKRKQDDFKNQRNKLMEFLKHWGPYDFTR